MSKPEKHIKLGIELNCAIKLNFQDILRDLMHYFYDSIGWEKFNEEFALDYGLISKDRYWLEMKTLGHNFSYERLIFTGESINASSYRNNGSIYEKHFKTCALYLFKAGKRIVVETADWMLEPESYVEEKGNKRVKKLGYKVSSKEPDGITALRIYNLSTDEYEYAKYATYGFFYRGNPLMGRVIAHQEKYAIYRRSDVCIPVSKYYGEPIPGVLYCNNLAKGRLSLRMIIVINTEMSGIDTRDRNTWRFEESTCFINTHAEIFDAKTSYMLLNEMKEHWNSMPEQLVDCKTWYYFVCQLVRNVNRSQKYRKRFMKKYHNLVYINRRTSDPLKNRMIEKSEKWAKNNPMYSKSIFVNPIFRLLGARAVIDDFITISSKGMFV